MWNGGGGGGGVVGGALFDNLLVGFRAHVQLCHLLPPATPVAGSPGGF
jgi:hypothetical protein